MASYTYKVVKNTENTKKSFHLGQLWNCHDPFTIHCTEFSTKLLESWKCIPNIWNPWNSELRISFASKQLIYVESSWEDHNPDYTPKDGKYNQKESQSWSIPSQKGKRRSVRIFPSGVSTSRIEEHFRCTAVHVAEQEDYKI